MPHPKILRIRALSCIVATLTACTPAAKKARYTANAERYFKAGQYDQAKIEYLNILRIDPRDANSYARSGAIWLAQGAPLRAGGFLVKAVELSPNDFESRLNLARVYLAMGRTADAVKQALAVSEKTPGNGPALLVLADAVQKKDDLAAMEARLAKFPDKNSVAYHLATAGLAGKKGDLSAADAALRRALAADPKSLTVHSALATLALARKDLKQAATEFQLAADLSPVRSNERIHLVQFKMQTQAVEQAKTILKNLTDKAPDFLPAWNLRARIANDEKKPDEALALVQNVLSRDPANLDARLVQTVSWAAKGEKKKAIDSLEDLNRTYPDTPIVKYQLARAYVAESRIDQAIGELDRVVHISPGFVDAIVLRSELQLRKHNAQAAVEPLLAVLKAQPKLGPAQVLLAEAYRMLGRFDEAANLVQEQIKQSPKAAAPYYLLGLILQQQNKLSEARQAFEKSAELAPDNPTSLDRLVELDIVTKAFAAGEQRVDQLLQKQPNSAAGHYLKGKLAFAQNNFDSAQSELLKCIDLDPNFSRAYELLIPTITQTKKLSESLNQMKTVLAKNPNDVSALSIASMINAELGDYSKARDGYEKILTVKPDFVPALNNLAYIYAERLNELDKGLEIARKARTLAPANPSVADTLGWVFFKRDDYQEAVPLLEEAADKISDNPEVRFHLGMAHYMMGQEDAARSDFTQALSAARDFPGKKEAERRLDLLKQTANGPSTLTAAQLENMLKEHPKDMVVRLRLADVYKTQSSFDRAATTYEEALKLNPKLTSVALRLAELYAGPLKNPQKALAFAKKARDLAPSDPRAAGILGRIAFDAGNFQWAYSLLQESSRQPDSDPKVLHDLAWAAYSLGNIEQARQAVQQSLDASPDVETAADGKLFLMMIGAELDSAALAAAKPETERTLQKDPSYVPALMVAAALDSQAGRTKEAVARYQAALQRFPDFAPAQKQLAFLYAKEPARIAEAYDLAVKARKRLATDPTVAQVLGQLSYERKEYSRALQLLQESAKKKPLDAEGLYYLGLSYKETKQPAEAKTALTNALAAGLPAPLVDAAQGALAELKKH
jgi:tetratricopeptide (TPR) repeat protein